MTRLYLPIQSSRAPRSRQDIFRGTLRYSGWSYPVSCGAFVALGMQESVEFFYALVGPWSAAPPVEGW